MSGNTPQNPSAQRSPRQDESADALVDVIKDNLLVLERSMAGYMVMSRALAAVTAAEKPVLKVITYPASLNGKDVFQVCVDLNKIAVSYLPYVLGALAHLHGGDMREAVAALLQSANGLSALIEEATAPPAEVEAP